MLFIDALGITSSSKIIGDFTTKIFFDLPDALGLDVLNWLVLVGAVLEFEFDALRVEKLRNVLDKGI